jgi:hypothetical protein
MEQQYINQIFYGFPSKENGQFLNKKTIYDKYYSNFLSTPFPVNDSAETMKELFIVSQALNDGKDKNIHLIIDQEYYSYVLKQFKKQGVEISEDTLMKIIMNVAPLVMRLKMHYQRPRPFQLGYIANIPLFPHGSTPALSPAYPSGHACQARYFALVMAYFFPEQEDFFIQLSDYIAYSRVSIGVHFPSDNSFGQAIAEYVFKTPETQSFLQSISSEIVK